MSTTVVIPNYNGIEYLGDCLQSLKDSGDEGFKVIIVDNGSTDGSTDFIRQAYPQYGLIALTENTGFAAAVNRGIEASDTEYVLLLNNDTRVSKHFVSSLEAAICRDDRIFSVSAKMLQMNEPDIMDGAGDCYCALGWAYACGKGKKADLYDKERRIFSACAGAAIYRREKLVELGMFDEAHFAYLEDVDLGYRARIYGYRNIYAPDAEVLHAGSGYSGSKYNAFKTELSSRNSTYIICKNMPVLQQLINLPFLMLGFMIKLIFFMLKGYGGIYLGGLIKGIRMGYSKEGRLKRVRFKPDNIVNYVLIQLELWINMFRRLA